MTLHIEVTTPTASLGTKPALIELHKGEWANDLKEGDSVSVARGLSGKVLKTLYLDFSFFDERLNAALGQKAQGWLKQNRPWAERVCARVNRSDLSELLLHCQLAQIIVDKLLDTQVETNLIRREDKYRDPSLKLSDFIGMSACAERAALGQYIFKKLGENCAYMGGIHAVSSDDELILEGHSFLVLTDQGLIWDVTQKHQENIARILVPEKEFTLERFAGLSPRQAEHPKTGLVFCQALLKPESGSYYGLGMGPVSIPLNLSKD